MASIAMMLGGALVNALAFSGSSYLFSSLGGGDAERKRHDEAVEKLNEAHEAWVRKRTQRQDWENMHIRRSKQAQADYQSGAIAAEQAFRATEPPLPGKEPVLSDYYTPSQSQKDREIGFIVVGITALGTAAYMYS